MVVKVLVPRRADNGWRDELWAFVRDRWKQAGYEVVEGHHDDGPFNRSSAINQAAGAAGRWDIAIVADADSVPPMAIDNAVRYAAAIEGMVLAYTEYVYLQRGFTRRFLEDDGSHSPAERDIGWTKDNGVSGCFAIARPLWEQTGGFDERFRGWGFEDRAFYLACRELDGTVERVPGQLLHLWHPRSGGRTKITPDFERNRDLCSRYREARGHAAMRALLNERP